MNLHTFLVSSTTVVALSAGMGAAAATEPSSATDRLIPRDVLFGNPDRAAPQISPDGTRLAFLAPHNNVMNVWVQTLGKDDARPVTNSTHRPIRNYFWARNNEQIIYLQDKGGDENWRVYAVNLDDEKEIDLTPFDGIQARITATDREKPDNILISMNNRNPQLHDVWNINTRTGDRELVYENKEGWIGFVTDSEYNVRMANRILPDGGSELFIRAGDDWKPFERWDQQDALTSGPMGITRDGDTLYMLNSKGIDKAALYRIDLSEGGNEPELVFASDTADINGAVTDPDTGHPQAVSWEFARTEWKVLDDAIKPDWDYLSRVEDGEFSITSRNRANTMWTVTYVVDDGPVKYYLYDRSAKKATYLYSNRSELEKYTLSKMKPVVIKSRDGMNLVSYLTIPAAAQDNPRDLPMVLLVHGGPWARDSWGYNPLHQWLANRGYAVLSVNYRGSTGMGKNFINAGNREWAGKMHDDLIDAVNWAIDEGIADPNKVAIMGGSYGGYATLVGLTFTPDVFACGVDIVGPSHVGTLLASIPPYWKPVLGMFESRVAYASETEYLDSISPLTKVDNIKRPLLIGQGANDPRVKQAESEQIVEAMQKKNIPVTYVLFPDEGHGFARPANNLAFFAITETFLAENLGGKYQPIDDDVRNSSAEVKAGAELINGLGG